MWYDLKKDKTKSCERKVELGESSDGYEAKFNKRTNGKETPTFAVSLKIIRILQVSARIC